MVPRHAIGAQQATLCAAFQKDSQLGLHHNSIKDAPVPSAGSHLQPPPLKTQPGGLH
jgi:hypothetical protein